MRAKSRSIAIPSAVGAAAVLAAAAWILGSEPPPLAVCRLPDGTVLRLDAVTLGPEHHFVKGRYGQRLLAALLPSAFKGASGATTFNFHSTNPPAIILWMSGVEIPIRRRPGRRAGAMRSLDDAPYVVLADENGSSVRATARPIYIPLSFVRGVRLGGEFERGYPLPAFPRRGRNLTLRIYRAHGPAREVPVAQFTVPNPDPGPHPTWRPEPLPITTRAGDLAVTLTRLVAETDPPGVSRSPISRWFMHAVFDFQLLPRSWTSASFRVTRDGTPAPEWEPVGMTVSDATGNVMVPVNSMYYLKGGESHFEFPSHLPPSEGAWKLRTEFVPASGFAPSDLWTVRGFPLPRGEQRTHTGVTAVLHGVRLDLTLQAWRWGSDSVIDTQATPQIDGLRLGLVQAIDDRGRKWSPVNPCRLAVLPARREFEQNDLEVIAPKGTLTDSDSWRPTPMRSYGLPVPADAKSLDVTFAVVKSRFVEFVARPVRQ